MSEGEEKDGNGGFYRREKSAIVLLPSTISGGIRGPRTKGDQVI